MTHDKGTTVNLNERCRTQAHELAHLLGINLTDVVACSIQVLHAVHYAKPPEASATKPRFSTPQIAFSAEEKAAMDRKHAFLRNNPDQRHAR